MTANSEGAYDRPATKADVAGTHTEIAKVRTELADVRTELANVRTENAEAEARTAQRIADAQARNTRWLIAIGGLIVAAITLLDRLFG